eukprot:TRINITY_DN35388_c0_g1_i1.p1 TRINITY_DN35388_c0_g1~~TRINITY_DN35388_c0_g1_i1.p1  ORF type:complete len:348 (+),score=58.33 TRINITY_DN35388_c0_g1_i1:216-1259(+)
MSECCDFLRWLGYDASSDSEWSEAHLARIAGKSNLHLDINLVGHEEIEGHTWYTIHCKMFKPDGQQHGEPSAEPVQWVRHRRLIHLREELHDAVRCRLSDQEYQEHFGSTPFARYGGFPGTTARLSAWCRALATALNAGVLPPSLAATTLMVLSVPVKDSALASLVSSCLPDGEEPAKSPAGRPEGESDAAEKTGGYKLGWCATPVDAASDPRYQGLRAGDGILLPKPQPREKSGGGAAVSEGAVDGKFPSDHSPCHSLPDGSPVASNSHGTFHSIGSQSDPPSIQSEEESDATAEQQAAAAALQARAMQAAAAQAAAGRPTAHAHAAGGEAAAEEGCRFLARVAFA